ncbi:metal ABC transporter permease [Leptolyngbya sp. 15MV]|nr:metal ABC transporter permease [Leptolyngbya sp. 15MV]
MEPLAQQPSVVELAWNVATLRAGYNTTVVVISAALLGLAAGVVGAVAMLRQRAMMADVLAHCTLPGIAIAFMVATALGAQGRSLPVLLAGAISSCRAIASGC